MALNGTLPRTRKAFTPFPAFPPEVIRCVEAPGFKAFVQEQVRLDVNTRARLDASMQVGAVTENVTVTADGALLQTDTTQLGTQINPQTIDHAALISRNPVALTLLAPGVVVEPT